MQNRLASVITAFVLLVAFVACEDVVGQQRGTNSARNSAANLSRESAKVILNNTAALTSASDVPFVAPPEACIRESYCRSNGSLTEDGIYYFRQIPNLNNYWSRFAAQTVGGGARFTPTGQVRRTVTAVTGIAETGTAASRQVEFTWTYAGLSDVALRYSGQTGITHEGTAAFQKYDDGWRILMLNGQPQIRLSEQTPPKAFVWDNVRTAKWDAEDRARLEAIRVAKTPTQVIASYEFNSHSQYGPVKYSLVIKDNGFSLSMPPPWARNIAYLSYGDCARPRTPPFPGARKIDFICEWGTERTHGNLWVESDQNEPIDRALEQLLKAYDEWRSKYPTLVTMKD